MTGTTARHTDDCILVDEFGRQHVCLLGLRFSVKVHVVAISQRVHDLFLALRAQSACLIVHHAEAGLHRETAAHQVAGSIHIRMTAASHIRSELYGFGVEARVIGLVTLVRWLKRFVKVAVIAKAMKASPDEFCESTTLIPAQLPASAASAALVIPRGAL